MAVNHTHPATAADLSRETFGLELEFFGMTRRAAAEVVAKWDDARDRFAACQGRVRHTLLVNPEQAEELAGQVDYGFKHGCGIMLWAWHRIAGDPDRIQTVRQLGLAGRGR